MNKPEASQVPKMTRQPPGLRVLFAGTPEFALPPLQALLDSDCQIVAVLTQPDRPAGRGKQLRASPVKNLALENGLDVLQPTTLKDSEWQNRLSDLEPDLMVVVAYGLMVPVPVLSQPRLGCWNIHASLLPRWRGAAPIHRAVQAGDSETGVCIMQMEESLDTGPVYHCLSTPIGPRDTTGTLHDRLAGMGAEALMHCIELATRDALPPPQTQDHSQAVYAYKLSKAEAELDWTEPAGQLERNIRAFNPWPVAWCEIKGHRLRIWQAEVVDNNAGLSPGQLSVEAGHLLIGTSEKALRIMELQRAGGQRMSVGEFLHAHDPRDW